MKTFRLFGLAVSVAFALTGLMILIVDLRSGALLLVLAALVALVNWKEQS